jgi:hypothetical protein
LWFFFIFKLNAAGTDVFFFKNANFFDLIVNNQIFLWNLTFINWTILLFLLFTSFSIWRKSVFSSIIYNNFIFVLTVSLFISLIF